MKIFTKIKKSIISTLLIAFITVLALPVISSFVVMLRSVDVINKDVLGAKEQTLEFIGNSIDIKFSDVQGLARQTASNRNITLFALSSFRNEAERFSEMSKIVQVVSSINSSNSNIDFCHVYFKDHNLYVTPRSFYRLSNAYGTQFSSYTISEDSFTELMTADGSASRLITLKKKPAYSGDEFCMAVVSPFPGGKTLALVRGSHIKSWINELAGKSDDITLVLDSKSNIVACTSKEVGANVIKYKSLAGKSGIVGVTANGKKYNALYKKSDIFDIAYVTLTPRISISTPSIGIITMTFFITLFVVAAGCVVIYLVLRRNRREISALMDKVQHKIGVSRSDRDENEFDFILKGLDNAVLINEKDNNLFEKQKGIVQNVMLTRLLHGKTADDALYGESDSGFISDVFAVTVLTVTDDGDFFSNENRTADEKLQIITFLVRNVVTELSPVPEAVRVTSSDGLIVLMFNFAHGEAKADCIALMNEITDKAIEFFADKLEIEIVKSSGGIHNGSLGIHSSYDEAVEVMQYRMLTGFFDGDISYSDIGTESGYCYTIENEQKLIHLIKAGETENACEFAEDIISNIAEHGQVQITRLILSNIASTVLRTSNESELGSTILQKQYFKRMLEPDCTTGELKYGVIRMITELSAIMGEQHSDSYEKLAHDIDSYIEENYASPDLSVSKIGSHFYFTSAYISKIYKQQTGNSLPDKINRCRVNNAALLLRTTSESVEAIASKCGFTGSTVFIRIFKKYFGVTPGKYRETSRS